MSKVVGTRLEAKDGMEYDINVTCCDEAKYRIRRLERLEKAISEIRNSYDTSGFIISVGNLTLKYCPICGDPYDDKGRGWPIRSADSSDEVRRAK